MRKPTTTPAEVFTIQRMTKGQWREVKDKGKVVELHNQKALRNYVKNRLAVDDAYLTFRNGVAFALEVEP